MICHVNFSYRINTSNLSLCLFILNLQHTRFYFVFLNSIIHPPLHFLSVFMHTCVPFSVPGPILETVVGEDVNSMLLLNLQSGTEYSVQVMASYPTGQSEPLLVNAKTCRYSSHTQSEFKLSFYQWFPTWKSLQISKLVQNDPYCGVKFSVRICLIC